MRLDFKFALCIALLITMAACSTIASLPKNELPDVGVSKEEVNTKIHISTPKPLNTFKIGDEVYLEIKVISSNSIAFKRDFGVRLFIYDYDQWIEIPNLTNYDNLEPEGYVFVPYAGNPFNLGITVVEPKLPDTKRAMTVRMILVGYIIREGQPTNEITAGYVDVNLKP